MICQLSNNETAINPMQQESFACAAVQPIAIITDLSAKNVTELKQAIGISQMQEKAAAIKPLATLKWISEEEL